jgi:hypothetical protein
MKKLTTMEKETKAREKKHGKPYKPSKKEYAQESARDDLADYGGPKPKMAVVKLGPKKKAELAKSYAHMEKHKG